ncbi:hypothetical protein ABIA19_000941 [Sinorhizobium fredii]
MLRPYAFLIFLLVVINPAAAADLPEKIGDPVVPEPFNSDANAISFPLTFSSDRRARLKTYQGTGPIAEQKMVDPRLNTKYRGQIARTTSEWSLSAVRTRDASGSDRTTVRLSVNFTDSWNARHPKRGYEMSRYGYEIRFLRGRQELLRRDLDGNSFTRTPAGCSGRGTNRPVVFHPFDIPNDAFEAATAVTITVKSEKFFRCP